jgi:asparagine synthase (glutamine-hydrolysing)
MFQFSALPETFFKGIYKLEPAHYMKVDIENGKACTTRYWEPSYNFDENRPIETTADQIDAVIHESVRYHNVADVEVGSFLSSGIDSSYMAACLAEVNPDIKTFTVGFAEYSGERDEISWARELADTIKVKNTSHHITREEYWEALPRIQWHMDEPSADPSAVALYFVDKLAATQVKAVLSGEGADEFFGGYKIYQAPLESAKLSWAPKGALRGASKVMRKLGIRGANYLERASEGVDAWYYTNANGVAFTHDEASTLLKEGHNFPTPQEICAPVYKKATELKLDQPTQMQYLDLYYWLVGDILLKTDKMSMAHSLESRVPFLDREVFAMSATVSTAQKVSESQTKIALRDASRRAIPKDWAEKPKLGFPVPVVKWLREDNTFATIKEAFTSDIANKFFNTNLLVDLLEKHKAGADLSRKIWIIYMFLMWYKIYFVDCKRPD